MRRSGECVDEPLRPSVSKLILKNLNESFQQLCQDRIDILKQKGFIKDWVERNFLIP